MSSYPKHYKFHCSENAQIISAQWYTTVLWCIYCSRLSTIFMSFYSFSYTKVLFGCCLVCPFQKNLLSNGKVYRKHLKCTLAKKKKCKIWITQSYAWVSMNQYTRACVFWPCAVYDSDRWVKHLCLQHFPTGYNHCTRNTPNESYIWNYLYYSDAAGVCRCFKPFALVLNENDTFVFKYTHMEKSTFSSLSPCCNDLLVALRKASAIPSSFPSPLLPNEQSYPFIINYTIMYFSLGTRGENGRIDWKQVRL